MTLILYCQKFGTQTTFRAITVPLWTKTASDKAAEAFILLLFIFHYGSVNDFLNFILIVKRSDKVFLTSSFLSVTLKMPIFKELSEI